MDYHASGYFSFTTKLKDAIWKNLRFGGLAILGGTIYIIYMVASTHGSPRQVINFMMAMGNTYGMLLIVVLMGHGLVGLPKRLWQMADNKRELERMYMSVSFKNHNLLKCLQSKVLILH